MTIQPMAHGAIVTKSLFSRLDVGGSADFGFFASLLPTNALCFAVRMNPVSSFPGVETLQLDHPIAMQRSPPLPVSCFLTA